MCACSRDLQEEKPKLRLDERRAAAKRWVVVEHSPRTHRVHGSPARCRVTPACVHMCRPCGFVGLLADCIVADRLCECVYTLATLEARPTRPVPTKTLILPDETLTHPNVLQGVRGAGVLPDTQRGPTQRCIPPPHSSVAQVREKASVHCLSLDFMDGANRAHGDDDDGRRLQAR